MFSELCFYAQVGAQRAQGSRQDPKSVQNGTQKGSKSLTPRHPFSMFFGIGLQVGAFDAKIDHLGRIWARFGMIFAQFSHRCLVDLAGFPTHPFKEAIGKTTPKKSMALRILTVTARCLGQTRARSQVCCGGVPRSVLNPPQHRQVRHAGVVKTGYPMSKVTD